MQQCFKGRSVPTRRTNSGSIEKQIRDYLVDQLSPINLSLVPARLDAMWYMSQEVRCCLFLLFYKKVGGIAQNDLFVSNGTVWYSVCKVYLYPGLYCPSIIYGALKTTIHCWNNKLTSCMQTVNLPSHSNNPSSSCHRKKPPVW